jgi:signal transduction histidine kinase
VIATLEQHGQGVDGWWWILAAPLVIGLLIRRRWPLLAFVLASIGATAHHVDPNVGFELLDLAVPLTLYTLASRSRSRRTGAVALGSALVCVGLVSLFHVMIESNARPPVDAAVSENPGVYKDPAKYADPGTIALGKPKASPEPPPTMGDLVSAAAGQGLGVMLALGLAVAVGDSVRSRRAHLRSVEQRAADLEREQRQRVALATAAERARITRELHDVVAHSLSVIVVQAQGAAAALERRPDRTAEALQNVISTGRDSLAEMRRLLDLVRRDPTEDPELAPRLGVGSLPELVDRVRAAGTPVSFAIDGEPVPLPAGVDLSAYRIAQEALTNTIKHAGAGATASLRLDFQADGLVIEVSDDGVGGPVPPDGAGTGLRGIAERIAMLGGESAVGPTPLAGFRVWARLPLTPASAAA